jgi:hypothetical protein
MCPGFTNIESNVYNALHDIPTLTELVVLALYAQAIGRPYMRHVRVAGCSALDLGPFHDRVKEHCKAVIENPDLLLAPDSSAETGALEGPGWDRPDVIYRVLSLAPKLPNLRPMLVAFFTGALGTWERFTAEFAVGGSIAQATLKQLQSAWISPTNDVSEGALGQCRQMLRRAPTMTDEQRNARVMLQRNGTHEWARQKLTGADNQLFLRREARSIDASGASRSVRAEINAALEAKAEVGRIRLAKNTERRSANEKKLSEIDLIEEATYEQLICLKVPELDRQINKLRATDKSVRAKSNLSNKHAKVLEILSGLERRGSSLTRSSDIMTCVRNLDLGDAVMCAAAKEKGYPEDEDMCFDDEVNL